MKGLVIAFLLASCAGAPAVPVPLAGDWGGAHIGLHLDAGGGVIDYDCAHGTIGPVLPGPDGGFEAQGMHTPEHGGPAREGEVLPSYPVHYSGTIRRQTMTLAGRLENGIVLGPFTLERGVQPQLFRCL